MLKLLETSMTYLIFSRDFDTTSFVSFSFHIFICFCVISFTWFLLLFSLLSHNVACCILFKVFRKFFIFWLFDKIPTFKLGIKNKNKNNQTNCLLKLGVYCLSWKVEQHQFIELTAWLRWSIYCKWGTDWRCTIEVVYSPAKKTS